VKAEAFKKRHEASLSLKPMNQGCVLAVTIASSAFATLSRP
jgi:hypothetical protein